MKVLVSAIALMALASPALAQCRLIQTSGKCIQVPVTNYEPIGPGSDLPDDAKMVMNPRYYGLPGVDGNFRYYVIERQVYSVDNQTLQIIEHVGRADRRLW